MRQIIKLRQAYTESDLSFRFVIYAGLRFSCKYFACPNKFNCILVFTVSGVFEHQHTLQPCSKGFGSHVQGQLCNLGQDCREKSCEKSPPGWDLPGLVPDPALTSLTCLPGLSIALPPCCASARLSLGCSWLQLVSPGLLCSPCQGAARLCPNRHWAHNKRVWHVAFPSTCFKNENSLLNYRKKSYHVFIKSLAGSCLIVK